MDAISVANCLQYITPALAARLSNPEIIEQSEEIRFVLMKIANSITMKSTTHEMSLFCNHMVECLRCTLSDPFPEVRKVFNQMNDSKTSTLKSLLNTKTTI